MEGPGSQEGKWRRSSLSQMVVLWKESEVFSDYFTLGRPIGDGCYGIVYECTDKTTGEKFAVKTLSKAKLRTQADVDLVRKEILIMHTLLGVENCVQLKVTFEDLWTVFLVMELCTGGELFERVTDYERYSEQNVARLFRGILRVVNACHSMGILHRDLKPENFLLSDRSENATLKVADFGLSCFFTEGQVFTDFVGTQDYMAPELVARQYGPEADVWSAGVILFCLLSGCYPFWGKTDKELFEGVLYKEVEFVYAPWPNIGDGAKDLIRRCLDKNPRTRITAEQALQHEWVREGGAAPTRELDSEVLSRMKAFAKAQRLKKLGLMARPPTAPALDLANMLLVRHLQKEEIEGLRRIFLDMDSDGSGMISLDELVAGLERHGGAAHLPPGEVESLLEAMGVQQGDGRRGIDYEEFLAATVHASKAASEENLFYAFAELDRDGDGFITQEEVAMKFLELGMGEVSLNEVREIIAEADINDDGMIDYREFLLMMSPAGLPLRHASSEDATFAYFAKRGSSSLLSDASDGGVPHSPSQRLLPTEGLAGANSVKARSANPFSGVSTAHVRLAGQPPGGGEKAGSIAPGILQQPGRPRLPPGKGAAEVLAAAANTAPPLRATFADSVQPHTPGHSTINHQPPVPKPQPQEAQRRASVPWGVLFADGVNAGADWRDSPQCASNVVEGAGGRAGLSRKFTSGSLVWGVEVPEKIRSQAEDSKGGSSGAAGSGGRTKSGDAAPPPPRPNNSTLNPSLLWV